MQQVSNQGFLCSLIVVSQLTTDLVFLLLMGDGWQAAMSHHNSSRYFYVSLIAAACPLALISIVNVKRAYSRAVPSEYSLWNKLMSRIRNLYLMVSPTVPTTAEINRTRIISGGYESLIGNTPLIYLPHLSSLLDNDVKIYVKMENMNPGGTGKDRAARSMILAAERKGELPGPLSEMSNGTNNWKCQNRSMQDKSFDRNSSYDNYTTPADIKSAIHIALSNTKTHGVLIEGTSGSTGIALASISAARGHGVIVVMPDDQSSQKREYLERLGCGVVVVKNCSISNPGHYVNVARRIWEWIEVERRFDEWYWKQHFDGSAKSNGSPSRPFIKAAFMNQFENLANLNSHYSSTGPEIYDQLHGKVDAFVMSSGTGGTIVGVGGYLKDRWWLYHDKKDRCQRVPPKVVLVDPPGSSLYNKVKFDVAYTTQMSEQKLRRHRYDTLAEGIGLDRITANFELGCIGIEWSYDGSSFRRKLDALMNDEATQSTHLNEQPAQCSKVIDDAVSITDQQAVCMAHYLLQHEGLFVGSSTAMNIAGAVITACSMPPGSNVVTVVCDGGQRHTARFWNREFIEDWGLQWPTSSGNKRNKDIDILKVLGIGKGMAR